MKTIYQCEICGFQSEKKDEVKKCERRERKNEFFQGDRVNAQVAGVGGTVKIKAKVVEVRFELKTHKAFYDLARLGGGIRKSFSGVLESQLSHI